MTTLLEEARTSFACLRTLKILQSPKYCFSMRDPTAMKRLGVKSDKIEQVVIGERLTYKDVFDYVSDNNIKGYIVLANMDIFFDKTLSNVMNTNISKKRQVFCQLRFEYESGVELDKCPIFGPAPDAQDTWIWHTNTKVTKKQRKVT